MEKIWDMMAHVARYGHQSVAELREMTVPDLIRLNNAIIGIVRDESDG